MTLIRCISHTIATGGVLKTALSGGNFNFFIIFAEIYCQSLLIFSAVSCILKAHFIVLEGKRAYSKKLMRRVGAYHGV